MVANLAGEVQAAAFTGLKPDAAGDILRAAATIVVAPVGRPRPSPEAFFLSMMFMTLGMASEPYCAAALPLGEDFDVIDRVGGMSSDPR